MIERRTFGKTGVEVSVLGFGGSEIGFLDAPQEAVDRILGTALDQGINVVDTAECYRDSEAKIGNAIAHRRDEYFLFTKCGHNPGLEEFEDWDPRLLEASIDRSLRLLQTDCVDLVQLHTCSADLLVQGDVIDVLRRAREAGKTRWIGYSGDGENAVAAIRSGAFDTLQTSVNFADQQCIDLTLPLAKEAGLGVIAKRPVANAAWRYVEEPVGMYAHVYWQRLRELKYPFLDDPAETFRAALQFTLAQDVHTAIVGTQNPERIASNVAEVGLPVDRDQVAAIRARWAEVARPDWVGQT